MAAEAAAAALEVKVEAAIAIDLVVAPNETGKMIKILLDFNRSLSVVVVVVVANCSYPKAVVC